jgi:hypothetical protein
MNNNCFICEQEVTNKSIKIGQFKAHLECYKAFSRFKKRFIEYLNNNIRKT